MVPAIEGILCADVCVSNCSAILAHCHEINEKSILLLCCSVWLLVVVDVLQVVRAHVSLTCFLSLRPLLLILGNDKLIEALYDPCVLQEHVDAKHRKIYAGRIVASLSTPDTVCATPSRACV